ncbi:MAG: hypothetical protein ACPGXK_13235 [Phycisphaerae bacterium]
MKSTYRWSTMLAALSCGLATLMATGCASLAASTGPRSSASQWSVAERQAAHVGEDVEFDFVLLDAWGDGVSPIGVADYVLATVGDYRVVAEPDVNGHFKFAHRLKNVEPGAQLFVKATAFQQKGSRDVIVVAGEVVTADSAYDEADRRVADDHILLDVYQAEVQLQLAGTEQTLDPSSGVLRLKTRDGGVTSVFQNTPLRPGYRLAGPDAAGVYTIDYQPQANEVSNFGETEIYFRIFDIAGSPYEVRTTLNCP